VESLLDDQHLLGRLIAFPSVSDRGTKDIADFAAAYLQRDGATIEVLPDESGGQVNVVATLGGEHASDDRSGLVLSGHLDVVPADEPQWTGDPFTLREIDGTLVGRGACDMKGSVALFMNLFRRVDAHELRAPLMVVLTWGEELGSVGALQLAERWKDERRALPKACVIGEPTSLRVVRMHKGHLKMRLTVSGKAAHSGSPHLGVNAIEAAQPVLTALRELGQKLEQQRPTNSEHFDAVPFVALNIARIRGGDALNVVPEQCIIEIGIRPLPGMDSGDLIEQVRRCADALHDDRARIEVDVINDNPPMLTDADAPVYQQMRDLTQQDRTIGVSYASDGGAFNRKLDMDCVLFGPGTIEVAHRPDEFVPIDEMMRARNVLRELVQRMCRAGAEDR